MRRAHAFQPKSYSVCVFLLYQLKVEKEGNNPLLFINFIINLFIQITKNKWVLKS